MSGREPAPDSGPPTSRSRRIVLVAIAAALFVGAGLRFGADPLLPAYVVFFACLVVISDVDVRRHTIPNRLLYPAGTACLVLLAGGAVIGGHPGRLVGALVGAGVAWAALLCVHLTSPEAMGFGDVRLAFLLGLFLGWLSLGHVVLGIFAGFVFGAVVGIGLLVTGARGRHDVLAFGPFLCAGAAVAILAGGPLLGLWPG